MPIIDLRSDTVTLPTPTMREAMAKAELGDDVYGEDPTVNQLQDMAAEIIGKEAALLVPTGTMGNLVSVLSHCQRGEEIILGDQSHTFLLEGGGISALGGVNPRTLPNQTDGSIDLTDIENAIRPDDVHHPISRLIALENTHNRCGGAALTVEYCQSVKELANQHSLKTHLDGARIFNAAGALGVSAAELAKPFDSITFCLSKGLCAPVGSLICGSRDFIRHAQRVRKQLGGGMRQAGVFAAAGVVALREMTDRVIEDHKRARKLAECLGEIPGIYIEGVPATNMVYLTISETLPISGSEFKEQLKEKGLLIGQSGKRKFRLVTHYWIDDKAILFAFEAFREVLNSKMI